ncbi:MAG: carbohydrate binding domain-containing protein [Cytophagaceae bacterium]
MKKIQFLFLLFFLVFANAAGQNQLNNPGFEEGEVGWNFWGGQITGTARTGNKSMLVSLAQPSWSGADQTIKMPADVKKVEVQGWMKTANVIRGGNPWEMARIAVEFLDANGGLTGGYPPVTGQASGTTDWTFYNYLYAVPDGAKQVKLQAVLGNCTGAAYFDDLQLVLYNESGQPVTKEIMTGPTDEGEWYEIKLNPEKDNTHYVNWSGLLDAPAGKHGFVKVVDGRLQFEDGTPARFWGTNLVATSCFPTKEKADSVALRLSKMGCNLIRLHHMDAPWSSPNIFGNKGNTLTLSPQSLDNLDYLIFALKKRGIYIYLDLLVHRDFLPADGVTNRPPDLGGKQVGYFDPKIIELQKEYARQLLSHKNKYTKLTYLEEPAIIGSEFINESSAFLHFGGDILNPPYRRQLEELFKSSGYEGKKLCIFDLDYSNGINAVLKEKDNTRGDVKESILFLSSVERNYYNEMKTVLRSMGVKYPLAGSNFPMPLLMYQRDNLVNDVIITNDYWDHPQLWKINNDWGRILYAPVNNISMLGNSGKSIISNISKYKWKGKPLMVTEYNACYPNEYLLEGIPFVAAYSRLQGIDGLMQFDFDLSPLGGERIGAFSLSRMPEHLAQWVIGAPLYLRGDIKEAPGLVLDNITEEQLISLPNYSDFLDKNNNLCFITKVAKSLEQEKANDPLDYKKFFNEKESVITSETGELTLNTKNAIMTINAPNVQGVTGAIKDRQFDFPVFSVKVKNSWASVILISKDGKPLSESKNFYLVAVTPSKMTGQKFNESRSALLDIGKLPILAQVMEGELVFNSSGSVKVIPLSPNGEPGKALTAMNRNNKLVIDLSKGRSYVYEIKLKDK